MKVLKDLLYTRGNVSLDIARFSAAVSVLSYWGCVFWQMHRTGTFDQVATGAGCAAIFAAAAGWIHVRQQQEPGGPAADSGQG